MWISLSFRRGRGIKYQGLFFAAQDFREIKGLQQLRAIELMLLNVAKEIANSPG